jgi:hypothetical protein
MGGDIRAVGVDPTCKSINSSEEPFERRQRKELDYPVRELLSISRQKTLETNH